MGNCDRHQEEVIIVQEEKPRELKRDELLAMFQHKLKKIKETLITLRSWDQNNQMTRLIFLLNAVKEISSFIKILENCPDTYNFHPIKTQLDQVFETFDKIEKTEKLSTQCVITRKNTQHKAPAAPAVPAVATVPAVADVSDRASVKARKTSPPVQGGSSSQPRLTAPLVQSGTSDQNAQGRKTVPPGSNLAQANQLPQPVLKVLTNERPVKIDKDNFYNMINDIAAYFRKNPINLKVPSENASFIQKRK